jgi:hypothetical protein
MAEWRPIDEFFGYSISDDGRVRADKSGRILAQSENQFGLMQVGMMRDGVQFHRSVPLLVAKAFIPRPSEAYDTPINLDGDRRNNQVNNLLWRPRWFAIKYNQQFKYPFEQPIMAPLVDLKTGLISENSTVCAIDYGLLERDLVLSVLNRTYVWPTYQEFGIVEK